jgi:hypothetical protein
VPVAVIAAGCAAPSGVAAPGPPSCSSIEAFAAQLVDVGITYDYEPSRSPAELAERVDVVMRGQLTGDVIDQPRASDADDPYVGYEIMVDEVLAGEVADGSDTVVVSVPYNPLHTRMRGRSPTQPGRVCPSWCSSPSHLTYRAGSRRRRWRASPRDVEEQLRSGGSGSPVSGPR